MVYWHTNEVISLNWSKGISRLYVIFSIGVFAAALATGNFEVILSTSLGCVFWYYAIRWVIRGFIGKKNSEKPSEDLKDVYYKEQETDNQSGQNEAVNDPKLHLSADEVEQVLRSREQRKD